MFGEPSPDAMWVVIAATRILVDCSHSGNYMVSNSSHDVSAMINALCANKIFPASSHLQQPEPLTQGKGYMALGRTF